MQNMARCVPARCCISCSCMLYGVEVLDVESGQYFANCPGAQWDSSSPTDASQQTCGLLVVFLPLCFPLSNLPLH